MRAVLQRVVTAKVEVAGEVVGEIGRGLLVLLAVAPTDGEAEVAWMADKIVGLRIFADDDGKMNRSVVDVGGSVLCVSQFTLYGDVRKGKRPSFVGSAPGAVADPVWRAVCERMAASVPVARGVFAADMQVALTNDGPVTLILDSP